MSIQVSTNRYQRLLGQLGRAGLSALYPNDFEAYIIGLELTTWDGKTIDYLAFPVMPNSIQQTEPKRTTIKQTGNGVTALTIGTFTPKEITIRGNFGRNFKILAGRAFSGFSKPTYSIQSGKRTIESLHDTNTTAKFNPFDFGIKTGYGVTKMLQAMIDKSNGLDSNGKQFMLYFYNMALGENYLVKIPPNGFNLNQSMSSNMIWEYSLTMVAVAPLNYVLGNAKSNQNRLTLAATSIVQTGVQQVVSDIFSNIL